MSFLITKDFADITDALTSNVEGIVWQQAVPEEVITTVTSFDFNEIANIHRKGIHRGRDADKKEAVVVTWLSKIFPELSVVDEHAKEVKRQFSDIPKKKGRPRLGRWNSPSCHHISPEAVVIPAVTPHVDGINGKKLVRGSLGSEWVKRANPNDYPEIKVISTLNTDNEEATILIPREKAGNPDPERNCNYPEAELSDTVRTKPGDIVILKKYVTLHCAPGSNTRRWVTTY